MARNDIRTDGRPIPLTHHSARGKVQRNSGNFTRGSQLLTHELLMWFAGAKLPFVVWFFVFLAARFVIMSLKLDEHGFQLVCMKLYAMLWDWVGFDPTKRVNVRLPSGELHRTIMAVVPLMPEVQRARASPCAAFSARCFSRCSSPFPCRSGSSISRVAVARRSFRSGTSAALCLSIARSSLPRSRSITRPPSRRTCANASRACRPSRCSRFPSRRASAPESTIPTRSPASPFRTGWSSRTPC